MRDGLDYFEKFEEYRESVNKNDDDWFNFIKMRVSVYKG